METRDKIEAVREAQELLQRAIDLLEKADLGDYVQAYIINHLKIISSSDHGFMDSSANLDEVIEGLYNEDEDNQW